MLALTRKLLIRLKIKHSMGMFSYAKLLLKAAVVITLVPITAGIYYGTPWLLVLAVVAIFFLLVALMILILHGPEEPLSEVSKIITFFGIISLLMFFATTFILHSTYFINNNSVIKPRAWIVNNQKCTGHDGWLIAVPFIDQIKRLPLDQSVNIVVQATTSDSVPVQGRLMADLSLAKEPAKILALSQSMTRKEIRLHLKKQFANIFTNYVGQKKLAELQYSLSVEYDFGKKINEAQIIPAGIEWNGVMRIDDLHPYFATNP